MQRASTRSIPIRRAKANYAREVFGSRPAATAQARREKQGMWLFDEVTGFGVGR